MTGKESEPTADPAGQPHESALTRREVRRLEETGELPAVLGGPAQVGHVQGGPAQGEPVESPATPAQGSGQQRPFDALVSGADAPVPGGKRKRRRRILVTVIIAAALVIAAVVLLILKNNGVFTREVIVVTPPAVTLPAPTPHVAATRAEIDTPFYASLPDTVLDYAMEQTTVNDDWKAAGAIEAYDVVYTNGTDTVTLTAGQWPDADQAAAAGAHLITSWATGPHASPTSGAEPTTSADGAGSTGSAGANASPVPTGGAGPVELGWQNETALYLIHDTSAAHARAFYDAFPF